MAGATATAQVRGVQTVVAEHERRVEAGRPGADDAGVPYPAAASLLIACPMSSLAAGHTAATPAP